VIPDEVARAVAMPGAMMIGDASGGHGRFDVAGRWAPHWGRA
jgi:hypothetical protein